MLKFTNSHFCRCGKGECWLPTFDAESKNPKITNSHFQQEWGGVGGQLLMLSPEVLKSPKFTFSQVEEGG